MKNQNGIVWIGVGSGGVGDVIDIAITTTNPNPIDAWGIDLNYDPGILAFQGWEVGNLIPTGDGWTMFQAVEMEPGRVRSGGFSVGSDCVPANSDGTLIILKFRIVTSDPGLIVPIAAVDDLEGYEMIPGEIRISGDVMGNGSFTFDDVQKAFSIASGAYIPTAIENYVADFDGDGVVTAGDVQALFSQLMGG